jgi:PEP-CTERM motif-containing protein
MKSLSKGLVMFGAVLLCLSTARATTIVSHQTSNYGENPPILVTYSDASGLDTLTAGTVFVESTPPTGFSEEVLCSLSNGCAPDDSPSGGNDYALLIESVGALTPGGQLTIGLGSNVDLGSSGVQFVMCVDALISGVLCMETPPSPSCDYEFGGSGTDTVTINLPSTPGCIPSGLVFSIDEDVTTGLPTFGTIGPNTISTPEPGSLILLSLGLLSVVGFHRLRTSE